MVTTGRSAELSCSMSWRKPRKPGRAEQIGGVGDRPGVRALGFRAADQRGAAIPLGHQRADRHFLIAGLVPGNRGSSCSAGPRAPLRVTPAGRATCRTAPSPVSRLQGIQDVAQSGGRRRRTQAPAERGKLSHRGDQLRAALRGRGRRHRLTRQCPPHSPDGLPDRRGKTDRSSRSRYRSGR